MSNASCELACATDDACVTACVAAAAPSAVNLETILAAVVLLCLSGLFSGLTLGLMSLDPQGLKLVIAGGDPVEKRQAERILPLREQGNLLLCTLLLGNTLVNAMLAILTASITAGATGALLSTVFILIFGEIIPQSFCSRYGLAAGSKTVDLVRVFTLVLLPAAKPISMVLDRVLGDELGTVYSRTELKELIRTQASQAAAVSGTASQRIQQAEATFMCGALSMSERTVEQIMTRIEDVFGVLLTDRLDFELMRRICASGYTRIPVFKDASRNEVVGLLSTKDLILVDPEDALAAEVLLAHCGRPVFTVWFDHPVNKMFADFKRRHTHLAFVQRVNDEDDTRDPFYELQGLVTLEDVLEELIQAEIVDECDVVVDNVSKKPVEVRQVEQRRRTAWHNMLDPKQLCVRALTPVELEAISSFLAASVSAFAPALIAPATLQSLLARSALRVVEEEAPAGRFHRRSKGAAAAKPLFTRGQPCACCTVVLQGRLHIVCGEEGFESDRGPWTVLGAQALRDARYLADFSAVPMERTRLLQISQAHYAQALAQQAQLAPASPAAAHDGLGATTPQARPPAGGAEPEAERGLQAAVAAASAPRVACTVPIVSFGVGSPQQPGTEAGPSEGRVSPAFRV